MSPWFVYSLAGVHALACCADKLKLELQRVYEVRTRRRKKANSVKTPVGGNDYDGNYLLESGTEDADKGIKPMKSSGTVSAVLHHKGSEIWSVPAEATVFDTIKIMADKNIGALLVMSGGKLAGVFTERDYTRKVALQGKSSKETRVREIVSSETFSVGLNHSIEECMKLMTDHRVRHLPVVEGEKVVGLVSIGDLVNWIISTQNATIDQMTQYITGGYPT